MNPVWWKRVHNLFGMASSLFLLLLLGTGILLNHPDKLKDDPILSLAADPSDPARMLAGKKDGLWRSSDAGNSWEEVPMLYPPRNVCSISFSAGDPKKVYALERWGRLYASLDGGRVWQTLELPFDAQADGVELEQVSAAAGGALALLTSHGWLSSADGGKTWQARDFDKSRRPLLRLVKTLHSGYFFGPSFVWAYDFAALALFILIVTGVILWNASRKIG